MKLGILSLFAAASLVAPSVGVADDLSTMQALGKELFFDADLSFNHNMSCASCHDPDYGFGSPVEGEHGGGSVVEGSISGRFGNRKPPTAAYAANAPVFHHTIEDGGVLFVGGAFLDGRATGHVLGNVAADQAMGPFTNPVEMAMPHAACVVQRVCESDYAPAFGKIWGPEICAIDFPVDLSANCEGVGLCLESGGN
ncbi:cytochrome-c peroxidase [Profundibacter sp.]|uniref:cytochrome-c peroxidase n=1 Tax=Profundibacter sp. TaxID=3101071 RepID=UPI003D11108C